MLNCTDLACVLHHHHFYAHLHHLKHHLQDDSYSGVLGDGSDVDNNDNTQANTNETDSELSSLSHVDAPNDVIYMVCGVVIAMLLVGLIIILVAITINKLRKREESSTTPAALEAQQQTNFTLQHSQSSITANDHHHHTQHRQQQQQSHSDQQIFTTTTSSSLNDCNNSNNNINNNNNNNCNGNSNNHHNNNYNNNTNQEFVTFTRTSGIGTETASVNNWTFPPKAPTPNIYNCFNNDALMAANDKNGFKGFRKQFSGRFKRLVTKKPEPTSVIPPELKPQLKTIYVY